MNEIPVAWKIRMPVEAWILTLSKTTLEIRDSGKPQRSPALVDPVAVTFLMVMFCQVGVVAVMAIAVSSLGSAMGRPPLLVRAPPQVPRVAQPKPFAAGGCAIRFREMTIAWRDRQRRVLRGLLSLVRQTAERESR